jgi:hypothetical protein
MKIYALVPFFLLLFSFTVAFSQNDTTRSQFSNIEIGSKKYYSIQMKDGSNQQARIVSIDSKQTLLMNSRGNTFIVPTNEIIQIVEKKYDSPGSIGLGFGIPYGMFGVNLDILLYKYLYFTAGLGTGIYITPMYNIGSKLYLRSGNYKWRPRVSAYYGTNGMLYVEDGYKSSYSGLTVGVGQLWTLGLTKTIGIDIDILYIVDDSKIEKRFQELKRAGYEFQTEALGNIKVSLGLRYCF